MKSLTTSTNGRTSAPATPPAPAPDVRDLQWRRIDLHVHTPASVDYQQPEIGMLDILRRAEERGLDGIALTDHNSVRGYAEMWREIEDLELLEYLGRIQPPEAARLAEYRDLLSRILVLPGFEFTAQFGFHILAIFPEGTTIRLMEHLLLLLGVPEDRFGSGEVGATTDVLRAYEILADHGALVIGAHVNSTHGIAMQGLRFGGQTKIAYTQDPNLHAMEVTDLLPASNRRSTARFFSGAKTEYPRRMHCIQGSDAHRLEQDPLRETNLGVGDRPTEVLVPELSFAALKALFASNEFERTRAYTPPPSDPVKAARLDGNTSTQVFHESATARRGQGAILRDIVGFANSGGGTIYIGLSAAEKRAIAGVADPATLIAELTSEAAAQVTPPVSLAAREHAADGKKVVIIEVAEGSQKPHALEPGGILIRRGSETAAANRDEIVQMVRADLTSPPRATEPVAAPAPRSEVAPPAAPAPSTDEAPASPVAARNGRARREQVPPAKPSPAEKPAAAQSDRPRPEGKRRDEALELAALVSCQTTATAALPEVSAEPEGLAIYEEAAEPDPIAPTTGIEVLESFESDGVRYYTLRDLRYNKLVYNVTKNTDRRMWRAAIQQRDKGELDESTVRWQGDFGLWRSYRQRSGDRRYDLVYMGDGEPRVFFGVSEAGMAGPWRALLPVKAPA
ncbi:MAG: putative DNA binding domain-containing protein [Thermomicrobiales bacterium]|nr:putative DNA binding domain-containing protein [Thermomicrobiales bacterium]